MEKINFFGKEMNLLEAKLYLVGLKVGIIEENLTEKERESYLKWEEAKRTSNETFEKKGKKGIWKLNTEKEYIINKLEKEIKVKEFYKKIKYCKENGHPEKKGSSYTASGQGGTKVWAQCSKCGQKYERGLSSKEWDEWYKEMHKPMNI